ncbi:sugar phosphate isomerase/epimerase [Planotetraspora sp. A-T 1434]|uniref:sugar phosphate isomerase/epimerase family protein n=1 Tax=Planotetraspora sp. A-T 1434 TaxID=2979219 RepID=UPI0021C005EB|nr:sugar phosphate isomerase/epimerase [Planotetraspora sp. A-T 1434]MCT9930777.1 sugar phosphate isomerase/epimerase [Planotetraspora sp. A-T 1434]
MKVGIDGRKFPAEGRGPLDLLVRCHELGYDGVFFRTVLDVTPALDKGLLADLRDLAGDLGLYLEMGLGKVNPYNTAEAPEVRAAGDGDYLLGMTRMVEACAAAGCVSLWCDTANYQRHEWGLQANDRFRTDVVWEDQLEATRKFLLRLAPVVRDHGAWLAMETHEEITTTEILRLADAVDVLGVTLDLANVVVRGEDPVAATRRLGPLVRKTHMRDVTLFQTPRGLERQIRACGDGVIDWHAVLAELDPSVNLTIENATSRDWNDIPIYDPSWRRAHPDLDVGELLELVRLARLCEERVREGVMPGPDDYYTDPYGVDRQLAFIARSAETLRAIRKETQ